MPGTVNKDRSRCIGRSRGGLTTKIHALVDAMGLPIALKLTKGPLIASKGLFGERGSSVFPVPVVFALESRSANIYINKY